MIMKFLGFGPLGIMAGLSLGEELDIYMQTNSVTGSVAAAYQSWAYGGDTPAGGVFSMLLSLAMRA